MLMPKQLPIPEACAWKMEARSGLLRARALRPQFIGFSQLHGSFGRDTRAPWGLNLLAGEPKDGVP